MRNRIKLFAELYQLKYTPPKDETIGNQDHRSALWATVGHKSGQPSPYSEKPCKCSACKKLKKLGWTPQLRLGGMLLALYLLDILVLNDTLVSKNTHYCIGLLGATLLGGAMGGLTDIASGWFGMKGQERANDNNLKIARENNAYNQQMWHMQNEYNDPSKQMERLRNAGLNPHLVYGQGSPANVAGPLQRAETPRMENTMAGYKFNSVTPGVAMAVNANQTQAQIDLIESRNQNEQTANLLKLEDLKSKVRGNRLGEATYFDAVESARLLNEQSKRRLENLTLSGTGISLDNRYKSDTMAGRTTSVYLKNTGLEAEIQKKGYENKYLKRTLETRVQKTFMDTEQSIRNISATDQKIGILQLEKIYKKYDAELQQSGLNRTDEPFLRMLYKNPNTRPWLEEAIYMDKGLEKVSDFFKVFGIKSFGKSSYQTPGQYKNSIKPNKYFYPK